MFTFQNKFKKSLVSIFVTIAVMGTFLKCTQKENSSVDSKTVSDVPQITKSELDLLPAKGPYFPCDERIIEDRWKVERFVVEVIGFNPRASFSQNDGVLNTDRRIVSQAQACKMQTGTAHASSQGARRVFSHPSWIDF